MRPKSYVDTFRLTWLNRSLRVTARKNKYGEMGARGKCKMQLASRLTALRRLLQVRLFWILAIATIALALLLDVLYLHIPFYFDVVMKEQT